jgi:hypothetical protein
MDWVKKHYELAILGMATLVLAANAGWIVWKASTPGAEFAGITPQPPRNDQFESPDPAIIQKGLADAKAPSEWQPDTTGENQGSLFVSRYYLLIGDKLLDPIEGGEDLHPPIPNAWLIQNGLDYANSRITEMDDDGDGFTNLEEFHAKTNPNDASSMPPSFTKLQLVSFKPVPFRLVFKGDGGTDGKEFQINFSDLKGKSRTQYRKVGDLVEGAPYKILEYISKPGPLGINATGDLSELKIENTDTGEVLVLVFNKLLNDPTSFGEFRNLLTNEQFTLKKGEEFQIPPDKTTFKLIDISEDSAQIQDPQGRTAKVLKAATTPSP